MTGTRIARIRNEGGVVNLAIAETFVAMQDQINALRQQIEELQAALVRDKGDQIAASAGSSKGYITVVSGPDTVKIEVFNLT